MVYTFRAAEYGVVKNLCSAYEYSFKPPLRKGEAIIIDNGDFLYVDTVARLVFIHNQQDKSSEITYVDLIHKLIQQSKVSSSYEHHLFAQLYIEIMGIQDLEYDLQWEQIERAIQEFDKEPLAYIYNDIENWLTNKAMAQYQFIAINRDNEIVAKGDCEKFAHDLAVSLAPSIIPLPNVSGITLHAIIDAGDKGKSIEGLHAWAVKKDDNG